MLTPFKKLWRGEHSLSRAFWLYFVLGQFVLMPISIMMLYVPFFFLALALNVSDLRYPAMGMLALLGIAYSVTTMIGVWKSANVYARNAEEADVRYPLLPAAAKLIVLIVAAMFLASIGRRAEMIAQMLTY